MNNNIQYNIGNIILYVNKKKLIVQEIRLEIQKIKYVLGNAV